jgi:hypothetical protein
VIAACLATIAHEAIGHGGACLASGGHITLLTSVYFDCDLRSVWIAPAGPAGNLVAGVLAWALLKVLPTGRPRARLLLLLMMAFSVFWAAGYLMYSMTLGIGDWAIAARDAFGQPEWPWKLAGWVLGVLLYRFGIRETVRAARPFTRDQEEITGIRARSLLRLSWSAAAISACLAAALYAPGRLGAIKQAALEIGAASLPLLIISPRAPRAADRTELLLGRSRLWIGLGVLLFLLFAATLGRGIISAPG